MDGGAVASGAGLASVSRAVPEAETIKWQSRTLRVTWEPGPPLPPREFTTQASGLCFTDSGEIVLVGGGDGSWGLPGGHPEPGETIEEALIREVLEEACAEVERCIYLGAQRVDDPAEPGPYYQTRWWARVRLLEFNPEFEMRERRLILPEELVSTLNWQTAAIVEAILQAASNVQKTIG